MHGSIREGLEDLLAKRRTAGGREELLNHLASCPGCATEFQSMKSQAELFNTMRVPEEIEPGPGFYARVLQRIEDRAKRSIWASFIYSPFSKRLLYASLTLAILLGTYVVGREEGDGHLGVTNTASIEQNMDQDAPVVGDPAQQRDAVLVNLVSYEAVQ